MGNIGRSSTGCATCRKRKIKCDEARPGCRRCAQIRKPCPGYPHIQLDLRQPQPGPTAATIATPLLPTPLTQVRSTLGPLLQLPTTSDPSLSSPALPPALVDVSPGSYLYDFVIKDEESDDFTRSTPSYSGSTSPQSPPKYDIQHQAVCFFLHLFCFQAGKLYSFPVIDFVPLILRRAPGNSPVSLAAAAVSRLTLADQYSGTDVRLQSDHEYSNAITSTMTSLKDRKVATQDATVVAVWLLGLYEAINSVMNHGRTTSRHPSAAFRAQSRSDDVEFQSHISHIRGAMHLLRLRGTSQFDHPQSEKIFRVFKAAIQMRLFTLNSITSRDFGDRALDNVYTDEHEIVPSVTARRTSVFFLRIARLLEDMKEFIFSPSSKCKHLTKVTAGEMGKEESSCETLDKIRDFIDTGIRMDRSMEHWSDREPGWSMLDVGASLKGTPWSLYPGHALHYFYSIWVFLYWIRYLVARIKLYEALIELVKFHPARRGSRAAQMEKQQIASYAGAFQDTASKFIGLTAYALGDISPAGSFYSSQPPVGGDHVGSEAHFSYHQKRRLRCQQDMNVVAAMQLVIPLKSLRRSEWLTGPQKGAVDLAIGLIGDGFRRQPWLYD
ncbi:hypothetical protein DV737_g3731, partial [Chaetothyriales sp. CBS 132003]